MIQDQNRFTTSSHFVDLPRLAKLEIVRILYFLTVQLVKMFVFCGLMAVCHFHFKNSVNDSICRRIPIKQTLISGVLDTQWYNLSLTHTLSLSPTQQICRKRLGLEGL